MFKLTVVILPVHDTDTKADVACKNILFI